MLKLWPSTSCLLISILSSSFSYASSSTSISNSGQFALRSRQKILSSSSFDQRNNEPRVKVETSNQSLVNNAADSHQGDQNSLVLILGGLSSGVLGLITSGYGFRLFTKSVKEPNIFLHAQYGKVLCLGTAASILGFTMMGVGIHSYIDQNH